MLTRAASGASEKYELQSWAEKRSSLAVGASGHSIDGWVVWKQSKQAADLQLALALPPLMQNIRTKVFQLTAESAADKHQLDQLGCQHQLRYQHQLRCQHAGDGPPAEVKLRSPSYKSKSLSEFRCKPLLAIVTGSEFIIFTFCRNDELIVSWPSLFKHVLKFFWSVGKTSQISQI